MFPERTDDGAFAIHQQFMGRALIEDAYAGFHRHGAHRPHIFRPTQAAILGDAVFGME